MYYLTVDDKNKPRVLLVVLYIFVYGLWDPILNLFVQSG